MVAVGGGAALAAVTPQFVLPAHFAMYSATESASDPLTRLAGIGASRIRDLAAHDVGHRLLGEALRLSDENASSRFGPIAPLRLRVVERVAAVHNSLWRARLTLARVAGSDPADGAAARSAERDQEQAAA